MTATSAVVPLNPLIDVAGSVYAQSLALTGTNYPIKVTKVELTAMNSNGQQPVTKFWRCDGTSPSTPATASGGTAFTPSPLSTGSDPSSVLARARLTTLGADRKTWTQDTPITVAATPVLIASVIHETPTIAYDFDGQGVLINGISTLLITSDSATATTDPSSQTYWSNACVYFTEPAI